MHAGRKNSQKQAMDAEWALRFAETLLAQNPETVFEVEASQADAPCLMAAFASLGCAARLVQFKDRIEVSRI